MVPVRPYKTGERQHKSSMVIMNSFVENSTNLSYISKLTVNNFLQALLLTFRRFLPSLSYKDSFVVFGWGGFTMTFCSDSFRII